jgi:hypothetical protein
MSLVTLIRAWVGKKAEGAQPALFEGQNISKIIFVLTSLFLYVILMETLGFILVTLLLFIFLIGMIEKKRWLLTVFVSVDGDLLFDLRDLAQVHAAGRAVGIPEILKMDELRRWMSFKMFSMDSRWRFSPSI